MDTPVNARALVPRDSLGELWMWLQLMWLQFEVVQGTVGVVWGQFGTGLGPFGPQINPERPDRTSDNLKLQPHEL